MDGRATFRARRRPADARSRTRPSPRPGLTLDDIDLFVYHQANARILSAVGERLELPPERVVDSIATHGNTSAASVPLALDDARFATAGSAPARPSCSAPSAPGSPGAAAWSSGGAPMASPTTSVRDAVPEAGGVASEPAGRTAARSSPAPRAGSAPRSRPRSPRDGWPVAINYRADARAPSGRRRGRATTAARAFAVRADVTDPEPIDGAARARPRTSSARCWCSSTTPA